MQSSEIFERKKQESIRLKNQAKIFAEKLARKKAEEVFVERVQPTTMFTETKKTQFIEKITKQYEPIFYKDIINKIISQKIIEEQNSQLYNYSKNTKITKKKTEEKSVNFNKGTGEKDIAQSIIDSSREVMNMLKEQKFESNTESHIPDNIMENNNEEDEQERLVMSILKK